MSVQTKMTALADEIRELSGVTGTMGLDAMASNVSDANVEVTNQSDLIADIMAALEGKAAGGDPVLQAKTAEPTASEQVITPDGGYDGLSQVTVKGDSNLVADNIKSGVAIFGVSGSYEGRIEAAQAVTPKEVNFYDYDGTCLYAYTVEEAQVLSALPPLPQHDGLVCQGWNWSLEGVQGLTREMNIGAMYITDDGTTRLYITLQEGRTSPMLGLNIDGTVMVDWGDGTTPDTLTGTSVGTTVWTPNHEYAAPGDYVIRLTVDGSIEIEGSATANEYASILRHVNGADRRNSIYQNALTKVELGEGVAALSGYAFSRCFSLSSVTIPDSLTSIANHAFNRCYNLSFVTIPDGVTSVSMNIFEYCYGLVSVAIPASVTNIYMAAFLGCYGLSSVTIPDCVTGINVQAFSACYGLSFITIPGSLRYIEAQTFNNCGGVAYYDFMHCTAVPTLDNTNAFTNIAADCEIRVPAALYDEWIAATNWVTYADYIKAY